jgi:uncharacterized protein YciI
VPPRPPFAAAELTRELQEAVRVHDKARLDALVSERLVFASGRQLGRIGKAEFVGAAMSIDWQRFDCSEFRTLALDDVVVVDYEIKQEIRAAPDSTTANAPTETAWVMTDVWALENGRWRLVSRHPELRNPPG